MFCSNILGPLWLENEFWNTNHPQLTPCFQKTVLIWIPCGILFVFFFFYFCNDRTKKESYAKKESVSRCKLCIFKLICTWFLVIFAFIRLIGTIVLELQNYGYVDKLEILSLALFCESMIILMLLTRRNIQKNLPRQGNLQFLSLAIFVLSGIPELCYNFYVGQNDYGNAAIFDSVTFICQFIFLFVALVLFCISHKPHGKEESRKKNVWPEQWASLPSRIFLTYVWSVVVKGYKQTLTITDLWEIADTPESATKAYEAFAQKYKRGKSTVTSLAILLIDWQLLLIAFILAICISLLAFVIVIGIRCLIAFTTDPQEPRWHGYIYVAIIFFSQSIRSLCWRGHDIILMKIGIRLRAAFSAAVLRKSLRLSPSARRQFGSGEIMNLTSVDAGQILDNLHWCSTLLTAPVQLPLGIYMVYNLVGNACWAGVSILLFLSVINVVSGKLSQKYLAKQLQHKDQRLRLLSDMLNSIKSIKLYAWEPAFQNMVNRIRKLELKSLKIGSGLYRLNDVVWISLFNMFCIATFATYTIGFGNLLTAEIVFSVIALLDTVFDDVMWLPNSISALLAILVSMKRLNNFFLAEDLADYVDRQPFETDLAESVLSIKNGQFKWSLSGEAILDNINLDIPTGKLVAIIGPVGAGKSSLISAAVGDMYITSGNVVVKGRVAYVPQQAWILNETVRDNVLFGSQYDKHRYEQIIAACELEADLAILPARDFTEIGERGVTLSGGQKQRISIARALYQDCDIYFLDDPLSAVDVHVQRELFQKVIGPNGLLGQKTRILVTHALKCLPQCDKIVIVKNGLITDVGDYETVVNLHPHLNTEFNINDENQDEFEKRINDEKPFKPNTERTISQQNADELIICASGKLVEEEALHIGRVSWASLWLYLKSSGLFFFVFVVFVWLCNLTDVFFFISLQQWTDSTANVTSINNLTATISNNEGTSILGFITIAKVICGLIYTICYLKFLNKASKLIHSNLLMQVLRAPASFFDSNPGGRVLNRFSKDMDTVDNVVPKSLSQAFSIFANLLFHMIPALYATPLFGFVLLGAMVAFFALQRFYANSSRQFQRLEAISRSPIYSCANETLQGAENVRIFQKESHFYNKFHNLLDANSRVKLTIMTANMWLDIQFSIISNLIVVGAALLAILTPNLTPGLVGMSVAALVSITETMRKGFMVMDTLEKEVIALERINGYLHLESEAPWLQSEMSHGPAQKHRQSSIRKRKVKSDEESQEMLSVENSDNIDANKMLSLANWPTAGQIKFLNYSAKYRKDLSLALENINLTINGGEKVGIVGRTGAGKSSMTLALCRFLEAAEGKIYIDGVDISQLGLHELRGKITVIPQDPALFTGTLRQNIDPFESYSDDTVWAALEQSHIKDHVLSFPLGLRHLIEEGGGNLSVGQRQLICLARAILRRSKILILDEPTASIDTHTDELIQIAIRQQFKDCTVITIAHRLETVMDYDSIVVLADGRIAEFGNVQDLLSSETSEFHKMAAKAGLI